MATEAGLQFEPVTASLQAPVFGSATLHSGSDTESAVLPTAQTRNLALTSGLRPQQM